MKIRLLITGATGFVGSNIIEKLADNSAFELYALLRDPKKGEGLARKGVCVYKGDVNEPESLVEPLLNKDAIIHCAALMSNFDFEPKEKFYRVNAEGTANLLKMCDAKKTTHFIHISTAGVYGSVGNHALNEEAPYGKALSCYEWSKKESELMVLKYAKDKQIPFTILRPSQLYGSGMYYGWLETIKSIKSGLMVIPGLGETKIHLLNVKDLINAVEAVLMNEKSLNKIYNVAGPEVFGMGQVFDTLAEILGVKHPARVPYAPIYILALLLSVIPNSIKSGRLKLLTPHRIKFFASDHLYDISRIKEDLGCEPRVGVRQGFQDMVDWSMREGLLQ